MPTADDFFEVQCLDLSTGGISFFLTDQPQFEDVVVALGKPPQLLHFTASVCRVVETDVGQQPGYMIGCEFRDRVDL